jgi:DNA invertase Pin-like site-specific DNA recombinase
MSLPTAAGIFSCDASGVFNHISRGGGSRERPEFQRMLDQLRNGDTVIVWKLDRLARSTRDLLEQWKL